MVWNQVSVARFKFEDVEEQLDEFCVDAACKCFSWQLLFQVYGDENENIRFYFSLTSLPRSQIKQFDGDPVTARVSLVVRNRSGDVAYEYDIPTKTYDHNFDWSDDDWNYDFIKWPTLLENDVIVHGALIVDAIIQCPGELSHLPTDDFHFHVPANPFGRNMLKLLESGEDADVFFKVGNEQFGAHKLILRTNAAVLADFCGRSSNKSVICIKDTKPHVFKHILRFIYGGSAPADAEIVADGREIINACDLYGVVDLKMAAECALVRQNIIDVKNAAAWLQYADSKTCPLLKEYALSYFVTRARDVFKTESCESIRQCPRLLEEVMMAMQTSLEYADKRFGDTHRLLSVNELRGELNDLGLDMDGSREMLVRRLGE